jgi:hypothetical protein
VNHTTLERAVDFWSRRGWILTKIFSGEVPGSIVEVIMRRDANRLCVFEVIGGWGACQA